MQPVIDHDHDHSQELIIEYPRVCDQRSQDDPARQVYDEVTHLPTHDQTLSDDAHHNCDDNQDDDTHTVRSKNKV